MGQVAQIAYAVRDELPAKPLRSSWVPNGTDSGPGTRLAGLKRRPLSTTIEAMRRIAKFPRLGAVAGLVAVLAGAAVLLFLLLGPVKGIQC
jgi:hypothetical protein